MDHFPSRSDGEAQERDVAWSAELSDSGGQWVAGGPGRAVPGERLIKRREAHRFVAVDQEPFFEVREPGARGGAGNGLALAVYVIGGQVWRCDEGGHRCGRRRFQDADTIRQIWSIFFDEHVPVGVEGADINRAV